MISRCIYGMFAKSAFMLVCVCVCVFFHFVFLFLLIYLWTLLPLPSMLRAKSSLSYAFLLIAIRSRALASYTNNVVAFCCCVGCFHCCLKRFPHVLALSFNPFYIFRPFTRCRSLSTCNIRRSVCFSVHSICTALFCLWMCALRQTSNFHCITYSIHNIVPNNILPLNIDGIASKIFGFIHLVFFFL